MIVRLVGDGLCDEVFASTLPLVPIVFAFFLLLKKQESKQGKVEPPIMASTSFPSPSTRGRTHFRLTSGEWLVSPDQLTTLITTLVTHNLVIRLVTCVVFFQCRLVSAQNAAEPNT